MKVRLYPLLAIAGLLSAVFPLNAQPPASAPTGDQGLFLTTAEQQAFVGFGKTVKRWVPGTNRLAFVWSDQPFAVHVPFQLETKVEFGRVMSKPYRVAAWMQGFGSTTNYGGRSAPTMLTAGLYRFDGMPCLAGDTNRFLFQHELRDLRSMSVLLAGDRPATNTWMPTVHLRSDLLGPARYAVWMVFDPQPRWIDERFEPDLRETERLIEVRGVSTSA